MNELQTNMEEWEQIARRSQVLLYSGSFNIKGMKGWEDGSGSGELVPVVHVQSAQ